MNYLEIIGKVSDETGISSDIINKTYKAYWKSIRDFIEELPLKSINSEGEFNTLRTNFNIPSLGKLSCTYDRYKRVKERFEYINKLRKRDEEAT